jgi:hypothetical protein
LASRGKYNLILLWKLPEGMMEWFECVLLRFMSWKLGPQYNGIEKYWNFKRWGLVEGDYVMGILP